MVDKMTGSPEVKVVRTERLLTGLGQPNVVVGLLKGETPLTIWFAYDEVKIFEDLIKRKEAASYKVSTLDAVQAFMVMHGSGSRALITGFLRAYPQFKDVRESAVGEILSRYTREEFISKDTVMTKTIYNGERHLVKYKTLLGESIYYLSELERKKRKAEEKWWRRDLSRTQAKSSSSPDTVFVEIRMLKDAPAITGSDMNVYGPFRKGRVYAIPKLNARVFLKHGLAVATREEAKKPTLKELFKGEVLTGYVEAAKVKSLIEEAPKEDEGLRKAREKVERLLKEIREAKGE